MARTYDALLRAEQSRAETHKPLAAPVSAAEVLERVGSLEEGQRELGRELTRRFAQSGERLGASLQEAIQGLETRRTRAEQQLAVIFESRLEELQRRGRRAAICLGVLLLWILWRI